MLWDQIIPLFQRLFDSYFQTRMTCDGRNQPQICAHRESDNQISIHHSCSTCLGMKRLAVVGFEPMPPERLVP